MYENIYIYMAIYIRERCLCFCMYVISFFTNNNITIFLYHLQMTGCTVTMLQLHGHTESTYGSHLTELAMRQVSPSPSTSMASNISSLDEGIAS